MRIEATRNRKQWWIFTINRVGYKWVSVHVKLPFFRKLVLWRRAGNASHR